jgi:hypothetical protein
MKIHILVLALASCAFFACSQEHGPASRDPAPANQADLDKDKAPEGDIPETPTLPVDSTGFADTFEVKAKFKTPAAPTITADKNSTFVRLASTVTGAQFSVGLPKATLLLMKAKSAKITSPELKSCAIETFSFNAIGGGDEPLVLEARDRAGSTDCQDFAKLIKTKGLQINFTSVPIKDHEGAPIENVFVTIQ